MVRLTDDQIKLLVEEFYKLDADLDDLLTVDEAFTMFQNLDLVKDPERFTKLLKQCDIDNARLGKREILQVAKVVYEEKEAPAGGSNALAYVANEVTNRIKFSQLLPDGKKNTAENIVVEINDPDDAEESDYEYYAYDTDDQDSELIKLGATPSSVSTRKSSTSVEKRASQSEEPNKTLLASKDPILVSKSRVNRKSTTRNRPRGHRLNTPDTLKQTADQKDAPKLQRQNALADPKVRKQLAKMKVYEPNFLKLMTFIQILAFAYEIYVNNGVESIFLNPFIGPSSLTLIQLGAKYGPCMRPGHNMTEVFVPCNPSYPQSLPRVNGTCRYYDNLEFVCGMNGFQEKGKPDQVWRFISPLLLHTGVVHLLFNLMVQVRLGYRIESQLGSIRMMLLYLISGIGGYILAALLSPNEVSVGSSGALYGMFATLYIDMIDSWPLLENPRRDIFKLTTTVVIALAVGLLPYIDNYAHVGGFLSGLLGSLIFIKSVKFGSWDKWRKWILALVSIPGLVIFWSVCLQQFFAGAENPCPWCIYLNCVPVDAPWCSAQ